MPKFIIAERTPVEDVERPYEIFLSQGDASDDGEVEVRIADHDGGEWFLLNIRTDGKVRLHENIPEEFGFDLDRDGRLKVVKG